jgi:hypothetical protein
MARPTGLAMESSSPTSESFFFGVRMIIFPFKVLDLNLKIIFVALETDFGH